MSRLFLTSLSALFVFGLIGAFARPALAVNCDVNACITLCQKNNPPGASGRVCNSSCGLLIEDRKKKGQCK
jgi:hypothetical protein